MASEVIVLMFASVQEQTIAIESLIENSLNCILSTRLLKDLLKNKIEFDRGRQFMHLILKCDTSIHFNDW